RLYVQPEVRPERAATGLPLPEPGVIERDGVRIGERGVGVRAVLHHPPRRAGLLDHAGELRYQVGRYGVLAPPRDVDVADGAEPLARRPGDHAGEAPGWRVERAQDPATQHIRPPDDAE